MYEKKADLSYGIDESLLGISMIRAYCCFSCPPGCNEWRLVSHQLSSDSRPYAWHEATERCVVASAVDEIEAYGKSRKLWHVAAES
jgi:hypothetical protein